MSKTPVARARLDALITTHGEEGFIDMVCSRVAEGEEPFSLGDNDDGTGTGSGNGTMKMVIRQWFEAIPERMAQVTLAKRCFADRLAWDALKATRETAPEDIQCSKLLVDTNLKIAAKLDRESWGDQREGARQTIAGDPNAPLAVGVIERRIIDVENPDA